MPHRRRRTWTVQSYSPDCANVHPTQYIPWVHSGPHLSIGSAVFCRAHDRDRPTDRGPTDHAIWSARPHLRMYVT